MVSGFKPQSPSKGGGSISMEIQPLEDLIPQKTVGDGSFYFSYICQILDELERLFNRSNDPKTKLKKSEFRPRSIAMIEKWALEFQFAMLRDESHLLATLSLLFPHLRRERVYTMKEDRLVEVIPQAMGFAGDDRKFLSEWRLRDHDLGKALEQLYKRRGYAAENILVTEMDECLEKLARRTSLKLKAPDILRPILHKCTPTEAKWLARIILKSFPLDLLTEYHTLNAIHPSLWLIWEINCDFRAVAETFFEPGNEVVLKPKIGVPIYIPKCIKGRGIGHVCNSMAKIDTEIYVETKYDRERMQIHVDLTLRLDQQVQIFSKSRLNSTKNREGVIPSVRKALGIGEVPYFKERCIVEAELVLWNRHTQSIEMFGELENYLDNRGGSNPQVNLMAVFFDVLMLDETVLVREKYCDRRKLLSRMLTFDPNSAILSKAFHLRLNPLESAVDLLKRKFAAAIKEREEGFMIKPANSPYLGYHSWMKLKKDHIVGLGDTLDFCLVGAGFSAERERDGVIALHEQKWNVYHVGCLVNKLQVQYQDARPKFAVMFTVTSNITAGQAQWLSSRLRPITSTKKAVGELQMDKFDLIITSPEIDAMDAVFDGPVLVELLGSGFERPRGREDFILRFPRLLKIHRDRHWTDGVSLLELQEAAEKAVEVGSDEEAKQWEKELGMIDRHHAESGNVVPSTTLIEKVQLERCASMDYGVEMKQGLDVEAILAKAASLKKRDLTKSTEMERKVGKENIESPKKRRLINLTPARSPRKPLSAPKRDNFSNIPPTPDVSDYHVKLGVAKKTNWDKYFGTSGLTPLHIGDDNFCDANTLIDTVKSHCKLSSTGRVDICVEGRDKLIKNVLLAAKAASQMCSGRWSVYFPRAAKSYDYECSESHRLWTYTKGKAS